MEEGGVAFRGGGGAEEVVGCDILLELAREDGGWCGGEGGEEGFMGGGKGGIEGESVCSL